ncbi:MAG: hypothetical protein Q8918_11385 [Bacteroidota bacterium]|nr:hypothetical protein [Bacteroidota bacterium]MDP4213156.1 hypothetical protein [Bacteroidota bacterium]MDP4250700.1 hypothetical protein [Bacteroidota bacterium]
MSQAFVKEREEQWLHEVPPSITALIYYLTLENNGIRVYEKKMVRDSENGREVHVMSNGLSYSKDEKGVWYVI